MSTASSRFAYLEAAADYFDGQTAGKREVTVRFGADSLTLYDAAGAPVVAWPLATIRRLPGDRSSHLELRLIPDFDGEERLTLRDAEMIAAIEEICPGLDARPPAQSAMLRRIAVWVGVAVASVLAILFVIAPMLADAIAPMIPSKSEFALGARIAEEVAENGAPFLGVEPGLCVAPEGVAALEKMTARLEVEADAHVPLTVGVLASDAPNAFALPGGHVFFMSALLEQAASPEEAAGVLAHEIGHVISRDPTRNVLRSFASGVVVSTVLGDFLGGFLVIALTNAAVDASYSREAEAAADQTAIRLLEAAALPATPLAGFFARVRAEYGDSDSYLASHPASASREQVFRDYRGVAEDDFVPALEPDEWRALQSICDERLGEDEDG